jgi:hypothetical protein
MRKRGDVEGANADQVGRTIMRVKMKERRRKYVEQQIDM